MEKQSTPLIFAQGVNFYKPKENAPKSIKGNITISIKELLKFAHENGLEDMVRLDLRFSELKNSLYLTLNTWKPEKPQGLEEKQGNAVDPVSGVDTEDIPFNKS